MSAVEYKSTSTPPPPPQSTYYTFREDSLQPHEGGGDGLNEIVLVNVFFLFLIGGGAEETSGDTVRQAPIREF